MKYISLLLLTLATLGCDQISQPLVVNYVNVSGKCKPNSTVDFSPRRQGREASTKSDKKGNFTLQIRPGLYRVIVGGKRRSAGKHDIKIKDEDGVFLDLR